MLQDLQKQGKRQLSVFSEPMRQWAGSVVLAIVVAIAYFLASQLSFFLRTQPDDIAWFWPAAGVASGVLIALGPGTRWPVAVGTIVASIPGNLLGNWSLSTSIVFALCNAGQVLLIAGLIERYFGSPFSLDSLRQVLGLVAAAIVGTAAAAIGGTVGAVWVEGSTAPALTVWYHWLTSNVPGIVAVAPLLIGLGCCELKRRPMGAKQLSCQCRTQDRELTRKGWTTYLMRSSRRSPRERDWDWPLPA